MAQTAGHKVSFSVALNKRKAKSLSTSTLCVNYRKQVWKNEHHWGSRMKGENVERTVKEKAGTFTEQKCISTSKQDGKD